MALPPDLLTGQEEEPQAQDLARSYADLLDRQPGEGPLPATADPLVAAEAPAAPPPPPVHRILEALFFVGGPALTAQRAAEAIRGLTPAHFLQAVESLNRD